jgi:hypothetical protein
MDKSMHSVGENRACLMWWLQMLLMFQKSFG